MAGKRWSEREEALINYWWGEEARYLTAKRVGRSIKACANKMKILTGTGAARSKDEAISLTTLIKRSGYSRDPVIDAMKATGITYHRVGTQYRISESEAEKVLEHLQARFTRWARLWDCCQDCGTDSQIGMSAHRANGFCGTCHSRKWVQNNRSNGRGQGWRQGITGPHP